MACKKLLIINVILAVSVQAINHARVPPPFLLPPLPPIPIFAPIPVIPLPLPTLNQIKNTRPGPGQLYNGVYAHSSSGFKKLNDGKLAQTGGSYVVTNDNGKVYEYKNYRGY